MIGCRWFAPVWIAVLAVGSVAGCSQGPACQAPNVLVNGVCATPCQDLPDVVCYADVMEAAADTGDGMDAPLDATDGRVNDSGPDGVVCADGGTACGGTCTELAVDPRNCGACGHACATPDHGMATCLASACGIACASGYSAAGSLCDVSAPRAIAPLSTARVTSHTPALHWMLAPGTDGAQVDLCRDRACTMMAMSFRASGSSGAPSMALTPGVWFWRLHGTIGSAVGSATSPVWQFTVGPHSAPADTSWGSTLDVNGDGFADVAVGSPWDDNQSGRVYVYYGTAAGLGSSLPSVTLQGTAAPANGIGEQFGSDVMSAGDVNGDGFGDLVVGAPFADAYSGRAYVFLGSAHGLSQTPSATLLNQNQTSSNAPAFGSVFAQGDVDGDGYDDLVVSAGSADRGTPSVFVYRGSASGVRTTPDSMFTVDTGLSEAGWAVSANDINGDGFADVAAGAPGQNGGAGLTYVYVGGANGISETPSTIAPPTGAPINFGSNVESPGDVDGDGYPDLLITAGRVCSSGCTPAEYLYRGGVGGLGTSPLQTLSGISSAIVGVGDVNGDGFDDGVSVYSNSMSQPTGGLLFGSPGGLGPSVGEMLTTPTNATGPMNRLWGLGDVNNDGFVDVAGSFEMNETTPGSVGIYLGTINGLQPSPVQILSEPTGGASYGIVVANLWTTSRGLRATVAAYCLAGGYGQCLLPSKT